MQFQQTPRAQEAARPLGEGRASDPFLLTPSHPKTPPLHDNQVRSSK